MKHEVWPKWLAIHTQARSEDKARINLKRQGFEVWFPFTREKIRVGRKKRLREVERPLLSRYIFVALRHSSEAIGDVNDTVGVARVVCKRLSGEPLVIPNRVMDEFMQLADSDGFVANEKPVHPFKGKVGDRVVIDKDDPTSAFSGLIAELSSLNDLDKKGAVCVWLRMIDAKREIPLSVERVTLAA